MAGLAGHVPVNACGQRLLGLEMAVLARGLPFDVTHAARPGLVAVCALDLFRNVHVLGQACRFGEILPEVAVAPSSLHRARVAHKGAPAAASAVRGGRYAAEGVHPLLARGGIVAVEAARMADVARLLLGDRLLMRERMVDLLDYLFRIFEEEPVSFRPADRLGVRKGRPSIIRAVDVVPGPHGALPEVRAHHARRELLHFFGVA